MIYDGRHLERNYGVISKIGLHQSLNRKIAIKYYFTTCLRFDWIFYDQFIAEDAVGAL